MDDYYYTLIRDKKNKILNILIVTGRDTVKKELRIDPHKKWIGPYLNLNELFESLEEMNYA